MTVLEKITHTGLKNMVIEAERIYRENDSAEEFLLYSANVIQKFFEFNKIRTEKSHKKHFKLEIPNIFLSTKIMKAMGYYDKESKEIHVVSHSFEKFLLTLILKKRSPKSIVDFINARMLFTLLHEIGHHHYYENNIALSRPFITVAAQLKGIAGIKKLDNIIKNPAVESFVLNEVKIVVDSERYADGFAFQQVQSFFPTDLKRLHEMGTHHIRTDSYMNYAQRKITMLVDRVLNFLPNKDQNFLKEHYFDLLEIH